MRYIASQSNAQSKVSVDECFQYIFKTQASLQAPHLSRKITNSGQLNAHICKREMVGPSTYHMERVRGTSGLCERNRIA